MARFLFTMLPANDLGLPTRLVPIARALADRGHDVAVFNPAPVPAQLIAEAGLTSLPMPSRPMPPPVMDLALVARAWDVEEMFGAIYADEEYIRQAVAVYVDLIRDFAPDVVVDSFDLLACMAAQILKVPLVTVLQGNFHPASRGFLWWQPERPDGLPSAVPFLNTVRAEYGLTPVERCVELMAGDLSLIVGTPETDPVSSTASLTHIGPIIWQSGNAVLPEWVAALDRDRPLIWVYSGNPRYGAVATPIDSIVVIRAAVEALRHAPVQVVLTTGYQDLPAEFDPLQANFRHAAYLPALAMATRCDLMVHHGGHSSVMTGCIAGVPAVIIPTITERESNARRLAALGAAEVVTPVGSDGEKHIDVADFRDRVNCVLNNPSYRNSAQSIAATVPTYGGANQAADQIERLAAGLHS